MSEIKWAYDESTGSFSALPASNFLLAAIGFICLLPLIEQGYWHHITRPKPCPNIDKELWAHYAERYKHLFHKMSNDIELTLPEKLEWAKITRPPWAKPGENWTYPLD